MIYFNNAATTQQKPEGVKHSPPETEEQAKALIAKLLGVKYQENIILTHSGSQAVELAIRAFIDSEDHVIATVMEQDKTCEILDEMEQAGTTVSYLGIDPYGTLKYDELEAMIQPNTRAIVCAHGCSVTGNITDLDKVCTIARRHNLLVISDGCQTVGAAEVNLIDLGVDVYCFTAHKKLMGPYGVGGICLKDGLKEQFEASLTEPIAPIDGEKLGGFCASLNFILEKGIYGISIFPHRLAKRFFEAVQSMDRVKVYGNFGTNTRIPTVSIAVDGFTPEQVKEHMRKKYGIVVKIGHHGSRKMHEALGTADTGLVRVSFGYFNNRIEVNDAVWSLMDLTDQMDFYLLS